jgi:hypothetical protein
MGNFQWEIAMIRDREQHPEVLWQEAAEMVAWIMSDVNSRQCPYKGWLAWETFNGKFSFSLPFEGALPGVDITHDP